MIETISNFFQYLSDVITNGFSFITNTIKGLFSLLIGISSISNIIVAVGANFPVIFSVCITVTIAVLVIKLIVGR